MDAIVISVAEFPSCPSEWVLAFRETIDRLPGYSGRDLPNARPTSRFAARPNSKWTGNTTRLVSYPRKSGMEAYATCQPKNVRNEAYPVAGR